MTQQPAQSPQFFLTAPSPCPYLEGQFERKVFTHLVGEKASELNDLLTQGDFRRSQNIAYRPACETCRACISVRILANEFEPTRSMRRNRAVNADLVSAEYHAEPSSEQFKLFRAYLKPVDACANCGEEMFHHRADDFPPYLAIFIVAATGGGGAWIGEWLGFYVVYKIAVGVIAGCAAGWVLGRVLFTLPGDNPLANAGTGVIALAGVLVTYGLTELIEGYGFIAAFFMGLVLRRKEAEHEYHGRLHSFSSALEHSVTAVLLVLLGGAIPALLGYLDWQHALLGVALIFIIRPISGMLALWGDPMSLRQRGVVAFYGVRGIGSIYYLAYAGGQLNLVDEGALWATVTFTILLSTIVHGFSAGSVVWAATHEGERPSEPT